MRVGNSFIPSNADWWRNTSGGNRNQMFSGAGNSIHGQNMAATSNGFRNSVIQLSKGADEMIQSLNNMRGIGRNASSPFQARRPVSENADVLRVSAFDANAMRGFSHSNLSIEVTKLATNQINEGRALNSNARATESGFALGLNRIAINVGDRKFDISFNVSASCTTRDIQQRIAKAINTRSDIDVEASVSLNTARGTSSLTLQSASTGVGREGAPNFTVSSMTGNAVEITGIGEITQEAQNAQFRVNRGSTGVLQTSRSNDVELGIGITVQLRGVGVARLAMGRDEAAQVDATRSLADSFNGLLQAARGAGRGGSLERELSRLAQSFSTALDRIGISLSRDGFMRIDEERMGAAAASGELERFAIGDGARLMNSLLRLSESVRRNPAAFVVAGNQSPSPMQSPHLSRMSATGSLFDTLS